MPAAWGPVMRTGVNVSYGPVQKDLSQPAEIEAGVASVLEDELSYGEKAGIAGRRVTVKMKYADFQIVTRSHTSLVPLDGRTALERISLDLVRSMFPLLKKVRLLGVSLSNPHSTNDTSSSPQLALDV